MDYNPCSNDNLGLSRIRVEFIAILSLKTLLASFKFKQTKLII